jgi:hypothetical protein
MTKISKKLTAVFSVVSIFGTALFANAKSDQLGRKVASNETELRNAYGGLYGLATRCNPGDEKCCLKYPEDSACKKP